MNEILHRYEFHTTIDGVTARVICISKRSWATMLDITLGSETYTFFVHKWSGSGFSNFLRLFLAVYGAKAAKYGQVDIDNKNLLITPEQKAECVKQACVDIVCCINEFVVKFKGSVLGYATWYCEHHHEKDTYENYITLLAAHFIVHCNFTAPNVNWEREMIRFTPSV